METTSNTIKNPDKTDFSSRVSCLCSAYASQSNSYQLLIRLIVILTLCSVIFIIGVTRDFSHNTIFSAYLMGVLIFVFVDRFILSRAALLYRKAYILDLENDSLGALSLLEKIGPASKRVVKTPIFAYHQLKALILAHNGQFHLAEAETYSAQEAGLPFEELIRTRTNIYKSLGDYNKAQQEISKAMASAQISISMRIDQILLLIQSRNYRSAVRLIKELKEYIDSHFFQNSNHKLILSAMLGLCELWTGHAEEGIDSLAFDLEELYLLSLHKEEIRPLASWCFLDRAYYYSTHQDPELALIDIKSAQRLCLYPEHQQKIAEIKEELKMRHNIQVTQI